MLIVEDGKEYAPSLSARRAWIEISSTPPHCLPRAVALRKESVDRNIELGGIQHGRGPSLSARRAWIEIAQTG